MSNVNLDQLIIEAVKNSYNDLGYYTAVQLIEQNRQATFPHWSLVYCIGNNNFNPIMIKYLLTGKKATTQEEQIHSLTRFLCSAPGAHSLYQQKYNLFIDIVKEFNINTTEKLYRFTEIFKNYEYIKYYQQILTSPVLKESSLKFIKIYVEKRDKFWNGKEIPEEDIVKMLKEYIKN